MPKVEADTGPLQKTSHSIGATKPHKSTESHDDGRMVQYLSENFGNIDFSSQHLAYPAYLVYWILYDFMAVFFPWNPSGPSWHTHTPILRIGGRGQTPASLVKILLTWGKHPSSPSLLCVQTTFRPSSVAHPFCQDNAWVVHCEQHHYHHHQSSLSSA